MDLRDDVVLAPDERLSSACEPIFEITPEIEALATHMLEVMYACGGCGLAAPQIGRLLQLVVIDVDWSGDDDTNKKNPYVLINPVVLSADGPKREYSEGCLSFPGVNVMVSRPSHVVVQAYNLEGDCIEYEARENLFAVCLQHEIDHVHGITMFDHLTPSHRAAMLQEYEAALAAGARPGETTAADDSDT